jgi:hypothetical protein
MGKSRLAPDAVGLEIGIAQLDTGQSETLKRFWLALDQQELPLDVRQRLDQHGLKVAIMPSRPPSTFSDLVDPREILIDELNNFERQLYLKGLMKPVSRMLTHEMISNRKGQSHPVNTSPAHATMSWTIHQDDSQLTESSEQVRGVVAITTFPQGDGSVRVHVEPQIHHGAQHRRIGATASGFKFDTRQNISRLEPLEFDVRLRSGESIVIGPTADVSELGQLFFGTTQETNTHDTLLVAADALVAGEHVAGEHEANSNQPSDRNSDQQLPELKIDQSKFSDLITELEAADVDQSLAKSLGDEIYGQPKQDKPTPLHRLLLIRIVQTQMDDLFDQKSTVEPLTSSSEY